MKTTLAIVLFMFAATVCGFAQSSTRCVRGIVTDRNGNPLASVVQIEDMLTLEIRSFVAGNEGTYYFTHLSPDRDYIIRAHYRNVWRRAKTLSRFDSRKESTVNLKLDVVKEE